MLDPQLPLNCPKCRFTLRYVNSDREVHVYHCDSHGFFRVSLDGRIRCVSDD